jgi:hypothetical protein
MMHSGVMERRCCALCGRVTPQLTRHHLVPRSVHGRSRTQRSFTRNERLMVVFLCRACHKQLHAVFTKSELATEYSSIKALAAHPEMARFIQWVARQSPTVDVRVRPRRR